jgi:hypothetical protein
LNRIICKVSYPTKLSEAKKSFQLPTKPLLCKKLIIYFKIYKKDIRKFGKSKEIAHIYDVSTKPGFSGRQTYLHHSNKGPVIFQTGYRIFPAPLSVFHTIYHPLILPRLTIIFTTYNPEFQQPNIASMVIVIQLTQNTLSVTRTRHFMLNQRRSIIDLYSSQRFCLLTNGPETIPVWLLRIPPIPHLILSYLHLKNYQ